MLLVLIVAVLVLPAAWGASFLGVPSLHTNLSLPKPSVSLSQGIAGNVTIANTEPLCISSSVVPASGPDLVVQPTGPIAIGSSWTIVKVDWSLFDRCALEGTFRASLYPGTYNVTLTSCLEDLRSFGCPRSLFPRLPITVHVVPGSYAKVGIVITTGIY